MWFVPYTKNITIVGCNLLMEKDTGSAISCISKNCYDQLFTNYPLENSDLQLLYHTREIVRPLVIIEPHVSYGDTRKHLDIYIKTVVTRTRH